MNLCTGRRSVGHEEICHEDGNCPLCDLIEERDDIVSDLEGRISELELELDNLKEAENG